MQRTIKHTTKHTNNVKVYYTLYNSITVLNCKNKQKIHELQLLNYLKKYRIIYKTNNK